MGTQTSVAIGRRDQRVGIISLPGEHDAGSASELETELAGLLEAGMGVVVDLTETTFADSRTLSVLLAARHQAENAGTGLVLVLPDHEYTQVHRLLDITGLRSIFTICPDRRFRAQERPS
jgi:anti-sigma B factor antagonist